jgi:hypothetical protein
MWDDVIIGDGDKGCSATTVFAIRGEHHISQNNVSYWISNCYLGLGMTIFKNTAEGKQLRKLIDEGVTLENILEYLDDVLITNLSKTKLKHAIAKELKRAFVQGEAAKSLEIRNALGILP